MMSGGGDVGVFCFLTFLLILRYPMKCDLLFSFYIISPKLSSESESDCTKEDTSLQLH